MKYDVTLGELLVRMGTVNRCDLERMVEYQKNIAADLMLGKMMVADKLITDTDLQTALRVQSGLRSHSKHARALAMTELAERSHEKTRTIVNDARDQAQALSARLAVVA